MVDDEREEEALDAALAHQEPISATGWLESIYRENAAVVLQAAYRVTGSAEDAEDVLQTVFIRLARRNKPPDFSTGPQAYLRRAATNAALDIVQSRRVRDGVSFEDAGGSADLDEAPTPERLHLGREIHDHLRRALSKLNRRSAEIFALRYFEELDNAEIAEQLGTTPGSVAVSLHRARARLKDEMISIMGGKE